MNNILHCRYVSLLLLSFLFAGCEPGSDRQEPPERAEQIEEQSAVDPEHREIVEFVEDLLYAAGNKNVEAMKELIFDGALVGNTSLKDSGWTTTQWAAEDIYEIYRQEGSIPYLEAVDDYEIIVTERMALVKADAVINRFGIPGKREINHMTLIRSKDKWKLFSIAWSVHEQPVEKLVFDIDIFARGYAQVWGSGRPEFVAMFYEEDGALQVNDGKPAVGRNEISAVAQSFMTQFPDMRVSCDSLVDRTDGIEFHWTLTGTDADPKGKGHKVKVSGYEFWTMSENNLIRNSKGTFSSEEYNRQLEFGIEE